MKKLITLLLVLTGCVGTVSAADLYISTDWVSSWWTTVRVYAYLSSDDSKNNGWAVSETGKITSTTSRFGRNWYKFSMGTYDRAIVQRYDGTTIKDATSAISMGDEDRYVLIYNDTYETSDGINRHGYDYREAPACRDNGAHGWSVTASNMTVKDANTVTIDLSKDYVDAIENTDIRFRIYNFNNELYPNTTGAKVGLPGSITENISNGSSDNYFSIDKPAYDYHHITITAAYNTSSSSWSVSANAYIAKAISSVGYATFGNKDVDVDFTGIDGLTAEKAKVNTSTGHITYKTATTLEAGEGALISGVEGTYYIPLAVAGDYADATNNDLYAVRETNTAFKGDANYHCYILTNRIKDQVADADLGFYLVNETDGNKVYLGSAYLRTPASGAYAPEFYPLFTDSETTDIKAIDNGQLTIDNSVYDLQGRRVMNPTKGLYIVNGKKVIIK